MPALALILGLVGVVIGVIGGYFVQRYLQQGRIDAAERDAARILNEADRRQKEILLEAKEESLKFRQQAEAELRERRTEVQRTERRNVQKEESLDRKLESLEKTQKNLQDEEA